MWNFYRKLGGDSPIFGMLSEPVDKDENIWVRYRFNDTTDGGFFQFYKPALRSDRSDSLNHYLMTHAKLVGRGYEHILKFDFSDKKKAWTGEDGPLYRETELGPSLCDDVRKIGNYLLDLHLAGVFRASGLARSNRLRVIWLTNFSIYQKDILCGNEFEAVQLNAASMCLEEIGGLLYDHWAPQVNLEYDLPTDSPCPIW